MWNYYSSRGFFPIVSKVHFKMILENFVLDYWNWIFLEEDFENEGFGSFW